MKRMILCAGILISLAGVAEAQTKKATARKPSSTTKTTVKKTTHTTNLVRNDQSVRAAKPSETVTLTSTGTYPAYGPSGRSGLFIADPTVRTLNARANGANIRVSGSGVIGMPRGSYGFANGRITLIPRGSRTIGTQTGTGSVGTGTSPASAGASGPATGLNGKNPYAGSELWPSTYQTRLPFDSVRRQ